MENFYYTNLESRSALLKKHGFDKEEQRETIKETYGPTGFPKPLKYYQQTMEAYDLSLEEPYFWVLENFKENFPIIEKLEDSFAASENSAFFGVTQQRLGAQQDKVSQFLATVGKMIKELFQMVRELRILDERLGYYNEAAAQLGKSIGKRSKSSEITLKGIFIDLVQGGAKNAASVFGMSRELEFVTLPDLFFDAPVFASTNELDRHISGLEVDFNKNVLRVLQRHLKQFMEWKKRTHEEHKNRRIFMLQYLNQHFQIIKMYVQWIKPYLKHVARLTMHDKNMGSADLISAFEGSLLDVEVLARKRTPVGESGANGCILATFTYRTRPEMKVVQEGYQRGPVHIGKFEMNFRVYAWTDKEVEAYKALKEEETIAIIGDVSTSVKEAMESLGEQLYVYLDEAKGTKKKEEVKKEVAKKSFTEKFFGDFYTPKEKSSTGAVTDTQLAKDHIKAAKKCESKAIFGHATFHAFNIKRNFKKAHRMIAW
jgi:hypothetical protein